MIIHLTNTDVRNDNRIIKEIKYLRNSGLQVFALGIRLNEGKNFDKDFISSGDFKSISLLSSKIKDINRILFLAASFIELSLRFFFIGISKKKLNIIHCHDTLVLPVGVILSRIRGSKLIYDAHELESNKSGQSKFLSSVTLFIEKIFWNDVDVLITVSPSIEKWYSENLSPKKSEIIYNSPDFKKIPYSDKYSLRKKLNIKTEHIFVYVGALSKGRFIERIICAFNNQNRKSSLVLIGEGELRDDIKTLENFNKSIFLHPFVEHNFLINYLKDCDFGFCVIEEISLSDKLCLPNKLFEYGFSGLKIIGSELVEIQRIITKYNLGITIKPNEDSLEEVIRTIEEENSSYNINVKNAEFTKSFSWENQGKKLTSIYKQLCAEYSG